MCSNTKCIGIHSCYLILDYFSSNFEARTRYTFLLNVVRQWLVHEDGLLKGPTLIIGVVASLEGTIATFSVPLVYLGNVPNCDDSFFCSKILARDFRSHILCIVHLQAILYCFNIFPLD